MSNLPDISDIPDSRTVIALLATLEARGIVVRSDRGRLHIDAPKGELTPKILESLKAHKPELLKILQVDENVWEAAEWLERTDLDGWRVIERADVAGLEIIAPPLPCESCGGIEVWQDVTGGLHCPTCRPPNPRARILRERANRLRQR